MEPIDDRQMDAVFEYYYDKYSHAVYIRFLKRLSRYYQSMKPQQAEDLLQDTFFGLFRWMRTYVQENRRLPSSEVMEKALYTIEMNKYINYYHKYLKPDAEGRLYSQTSCDPPQENEKTTSNEPSAPDYQRPDQQLLQEEALARVADQLGGLELKQRTALLLRAMGYSDREIATLVGEDEATVTHSIMPLARKKLRKLMGDYGYADGKQPWLNG